jgi:galactokinase
MKESLRKLHLKLYKETTHSYFYAPGRVNLIGEHTDYSGGLVLPLAINLGIYAAVSIRKDNKIRVYSQNFKSEGIVSFDRSIKLTKMSGYASYIVGVMTILEKAGYSINKGLNISLISTLPVGSGLSSSAALELLFLEIFKSINKLKIQDLEMIKLAQKVENDYLGLSSGIMDQFVIKMAKANHVLFLNTNTLKHKNIPINLNKYHLVLMNTNKPRKLINSAYNNRFNAVKKAEAILGKSLGKIFSKDLRLNLMLLKDPIIKKRVEHIVLENSRVKAAVSALKQKDYFKLGVLMQASHLSLKEKYEVSSPELDYLVDKNLKLKALGARMTGAGFGGTMIALYQGSLPSFKKLKSEYKKKFNIKLDIYVAKASKGVN